MAPRSIRPHSREQRAALLPAVVRRLEARFGHHLVAVAVGGSHARGDDGPYSDLDIVAIVAGDAPAAREPGTVEIVDGLMIDIPYWTLDDLVRPLVEPRSDWCFKAAGRLTAVTNPLVVERVSGEMASLVERARTPGDPLHARLVALAAERLDYEVPEHVSKLLNACQPGSPNWSRSLLLPRALHEVLVTVALRNAHPYPDLQAMVEHAPSLAVGPAGLSELCDLVTRGDPPPDRLAAAFLTVVGQLESLLRP
jgi:predicted nucleotidyltransferase